MSLKAVDTMPESAAQTEMMQKVQTCKGRRGKGGGAEEGLMGGKESPGGGGGGGREGAAEEVCNTE